MRQSASPVWVQLLRSYATPSGASATTTFTITACLNGVAPDVRLHPRLSTPEVERRCERKDYYSRYRPGFVSVLMLLSLLSCVVQYVVQAGIYRTEMARINRFAHLLPTAGSFVGRASLTSVVLAR